MYEVKLINTQTRCEKTITLPVSQQALYDTLCELGLVCDGWEYGNIPNLTLENVAATVSYDLRYPFLEEQNIVLMNIALDMWENRTDDQELVYVYHANAESIENCAQLINCIIAVNDDEIDAYWYEYDGQSAAERYGRDCGLHECPEQFANYVDWEQYGEDYADEYCVLLEDRYVPYDNMSLDLEFYDIDDILTEYGWDTEFEPDVHSEHEVLIEKESLFDLLIGNGGDSSGKSAYCESITI